ncbi:IclR family transcriptional regulator [Shumkonia mesophila]|uniref:IclR family transcriptional regulator n=1 Tax=Shumkonia mesophila TaxID=2838854 RepID=UPI002934CE93|nr:IclR family transcriptional regulator [Shumkonia mesophila]
MMNESGTVNRVMKLISLLADHSDITAKQAALNLGWPISTTHRLLRTLSAAEFATQKGPGLFAPGLELYRIAGRLSVAVPYAQIGEPLLASLSERFGETSLLSVLERKQLKMYIASSAAPKDPMRYTIDLNRRVSIVWGASGRALLAHLLPEEVDRAIAICDETDARGRGIDLPELQASLQAVRENGYAMTESHRVLHAVGVAVPFFGVQGEVVGSVAFQVPEFRFNIARVPEYVRVLKETAAVIAQRIGSATEG